MSRYPQVAPANYIDEAVAIGLGEKLQLGGSQLVTEHVFVAGTVRNSQGRFISIARYSPAGGPPTAEVVWPPIDWSRPTPGTQRAAKVMAVPVVDYFTEPEDGRIYIAGINDGMDGTSDIVLLAYDFNLKLKWMKSYNYGSAGVEFYGNDVPIAIATDQTSDTVTPPHDTSYSIVAVLGQVTEYGGAKKAVTLAYCKGNGDEVMPSKVFAGMPTPVDIVVGSPQDLCGVTTIFTTGSTAQPASTATGQIVVQAYMLPDLVPQACQASSGNGVIPTGWPRTQNGDFTPLDSWAMPARMKFMKDHLIIAGTTGVYGEPGYPSRTDVLTFALVGCENPPVNPAWVDQWAVPELASDPEPPPTPRAARAVDMDITGVGLEPFVTVTASAQSRVDGTTAVATMAYRGFPQPPPNSQRLWKKGGLWNREFGLGLETPTAIRCIKAVDENMPANTAFLAYISVATWDFSGFGYVTIKYDGSAWINAGAFKPLSWQQNFPYYFGPGNGNHIPSKLAVEHQPNIPNFGPTRRIWVTGTSPHPTSLDDWATQFVVEQLP